MDGMIGNHCQLNEFNQLREIATLISPNLGSDRLYTRRYIYMMHFNTMLKQNVYMFACSACRC